MENYFTSQNNNLQGTGMEVTPQAREFLRETAKWTKFLSILGFIGIGLMVLAAFFMGAIMSMAYGSMGVPGMPSGFFTVLYLVLAGVYVMPIYYLYQFSDKTKIALDSNDTNLLTESLGFLKSHYKYVGIMMIALIALYALIFIIALIGGIAGAAAFAAM